MDWNDPKLEKLGHCYICDKDNMSLRHSLACKAKKSNPRVVKKTQAKKAPARPQDCIAKAKVGLGLDAILSAPKAPQEALEALEKEYQTPRPALDQKHISIETERGKIYGDPFLSHKAIGYVWRGILQNRFHEITIPEIDASLVAELLAAFKLTRASRPTFHQDSFDDLRVYVSFSERFRK